MHCRMKLNGHIKWFVFIVNYLKNTMANEDEGGDPSKEAPAIHVPRSRGRKWEAEKEK